MKIKVINFIAQSFLLTGNVLCGLGGKAHDICFALHMKYDTEIGKYLKVLQKDVYSKVYDKLKDLEVKKVEEEGEKTVMAPGNYKSYYIKRKPQKDN